MCKCVEIYFWWMVDELLCMNHLTLVYFSFSLDRGYLFLFSFSLLFFGMPHTHKACQKTQRERDNPYPKKKKKKQERDDSYKGVHPPSTKDIFTHTCTS